MMEKDKPVFPCTIKGKKYIGMTKQELVAAIILSGLFAEGKIHEYQGLQVGGNNHFKAALKISEDFFWYIQEGKNDNWPLLSQINKKK